MPSGAITARASNRAKTTSGTVATSSDAPRRVDPLEGVPELEAEEPGPEAGAHGVEGREPSEPFPTITSAGSTPTMRRVSRPDRDHADVARDVPEQRRGDTIGTTHPVTVLPPLGSRARAEIATPRRYDGDTVSSPRAVLRAFAGRVGLALVLCFAVVAAGVVAVNRDIDDAIGKIPRVAVATAPVGSHGVNYLIIGSDSRAFVEDGSEQAAFGSDERHRPRRDPTR